MAMRKHPVFLLIFASFISLLISCDNKIDVDITPPGDVTKLAAIVSDAPYGRVDISLTWLDPSDSDLDYIEVEVAQMLSDTLSNGGGAVIPSLGTFSITSLEKNSIWAFTVRAVDRSGNKSSGVQLVVKAERTNSLDVKSFLISQSDSAISLSWVNPESDFFEGTRLEITSEGENTFLEFDTQVSSYLFSSGTAGKRYTFTLYAMYKENGVSYSSDGASVKGDFIVSDISNLVLFSDDKEINISWTNADNSNYEAVIVEISSGNETTSISLDADAASYKIIEGEHGEAFDIKVYTSRTINGEVVLSLGESGTAFFLDYSAFDNPVMLITLPDGVDDITTKTWLDDMALELATCTIIDNTNGSNNVENLALDIKGRGNSSWGMPKKSYSIKLEKKNNLLSLANGKHKHYALIANYCDKTLIRNQLAYFMGTDIFTNMDWNPHTRQVNLIMNGRYCGVYILTERIKIHENIVDISDISEKGGEGWILEVNMRLDETYNWMTTNGIPISLKDPDDYEGWEDIEAYINSVEAVLYGENYQDEKNGWRKYLDEDSFVDWYLVNEIAKNNDAIWFSSVYMYYNPVDKKIYMGPLWDFDIGFGNIDYNNNENPEGFWVKDGGWYSRLFTDPEFVKAVKARWNEKKSEIDCLATKITLLSGAIEKDAEINFTLWPIMGQYVWPNAPGYEKRTTYQSEIDYLTTWLETRIKWLDENINALNAELNVCFN